MIYETKTWKCFPVYLGIDLLLGFILGQWEVSAHTLKTCEWILDRHLC